MNDIYRPNKSSRYNQDDKNLFLILHTIHNMQPLSTLLSPFISPFLSPYGISHTELNSLLLSHVNEINRHFIVNQLRDHDVTMIFEDYIFHDTLYYRICITNNEATFCWKWICMKHQTNDAKTIASIIQTEISLLTDYRIVVTGFASSNSEVMREGISQELLKTQILVYNIPYISFMIEDLFREFFNLPKIQELWNFVFLLSSFKE